MTALLLFGVKGKAKGLVFFEGQFLKPEKAFNLKNESIYQSC
jgi:hypothetical protein